MPKKKSRKKSVKLSSSSSEDEKASKEQDVTKNCVKRKRLGISHDSCTGKQSLQKELILVLDTNILLSHLEYVKKIGSHGLGALGFPVILIPWVVLQELDSLKKGNRQEGDVAHLAIPALSYIHHCVKNRDPHFLAQSMQQAAKNIDGLKAENNDDRVLQCCLQYQSLYTGRALILCTNDKNLCTKSLVSGVTALSKAELEGAVTRSRPGLHPVLCRQTPMQPHADPQVPAPMLNNISPAQFQGSEKIIGLPLGLMKKGNKQPRDTKEVERRELSICVSELENCLKEVLSEVLEVEMKAAFDDLWEEIVYLKPPWTLHGILQCLRKHWVAVFGLIFPRRKLEAVLKLTDFLTTAKVECSNTLTALREAENLLKVFGNRSSYGGRIPIALHSLDTIICRLETQGECPVSDADMSDEEEKQVTLTQVSHQEVWTLFENIWDNVYPTSLAVFTALCFDPHTMQRAQPEGGPPPPQDALVCLHKLASMVSQLLQAFSRYLR
ncbi:transcriptional protein SWT1 [Diretmus argenteus]